jgi:hypothetical protein
VFLFFFFHHSFCAFSFSFFHSGHDFIFAFALILSFVSLPLYFFDLVHFFIIVLIYVFSSCFRFFRLDSVRSVSFRFCLVWFFFSFSFSLVYLFVSSTCFVSYRFDFSFFA